MSEKYPKYIAATLVIFFLQKKIYLHTTFNDDLALPKFSQNLLFFHLHLKSTAATKIPKSVSTTNYTNKSLKLLFRQHFFHERTVCKYKNYNRARNRETRTHKPASE